MASPSMEDLYHKSCALAEDPQDLRDGFQHPARLVKVKQNVYFDFSCIFTYCSS
jgi:hypothetical protein